MSNQEQFMDAILEPSFQEDFLEELGELTSEVAKLKDKYYNYAITDQVIPELLETLEAWGDVDLDGID